ncbi:MAG: hypothetical protein JW787_05660 [Sedimentisphaerales bacterium]|nr:hypothetical protein [Sedimentisphaerales bacterium]
MTQKTRHIKKLLLTNIILLIISIISGCGSKATFHKYMRQELLYLNEQPYSRLYVEVDSVEGVEVPDKWLNVLKEFLVEHCSKPDGIEIVRDKPIAYDDIRDMPIGPASILCIDGPDPNFGSQAAYLHVFFYNKDKIFKKTTKTPFVVAECPSTIFYNSDYLKYRNKQFAPFALSHEAGHVLGLCRNKSHGDGLHCKNNNCLMNSTPGFLQEIGLIFGIPTKKQLCNNCRIDITNCKSEGINPNLTFDGPFLIRKESGYSVATLPYCVLLIPDAFKNNFNWQNALYSMKEHYLAKKYKYFYKNILISKSKDGSSPDMNLYKDIFVKAIDDPDPEVKKYAAQMLKTLEQK